MKLFIFLMIVTLGFAGCDNGAKIEVNADSLGRKLDTTLGKVKDSVEAKGKRTFDAVKDKINGLRVKRDSSRDTTN